MAEISLQTTFELHRKSIELSEAGVSPFQKDPDKPRLWIEDMEFALLHDPNAEKQKMIFLRRLGDDKLMVEWMSSEPTTDPDKPMRQVYVKLHREGDPVIVTDEEFRNLELAPKDRGRTLEEEEGRALINDIIKMLGSVSTE